jgi:hypothetical protein
MKKFYSKFRVGLMTFAIGLASVFVLNGSLKFSEEIPVNLPKVKFEPSTIFFLLPKAHSESPIMFSIEKETEKGGAGASGGMTCEEVRKRAKNKKIKILNCE